MLGYKLHEYGIGYGKHRYDLGKVNKWNNKNEKRTIFNLSQRS